MRHLLLCADALSDYCGQQVHAIHFVLDVELTRNRRIGLENDSPRQAGGYMLRGRWHSWWFEGGLRVNLARATFKGFMPGKRYIYAESCSLGGGGGLLFLMARIRRPRGDHRQPAGNLKEHRMIDRNEHLAHMHAGRTAEAIPLYETAIRNALRACRRGAAGADSGDPGQSVEAQKLLQANLALQPEDPAPMRRWEISSCRRWARMPRRGLSMAAKYTMWRCTGSGSPGGGLGTIKIFQAQDA